jgi:hypothetical protein
MGEEADGDLLKPIRHRCCGIPLPGGGGSGGAYLRRRQRGRRSSSIRTRSGRSFKFVRACYRLKFSRISCHSVQLSR